ncbi:CLPS [Branchiostoma lanceolatum]|uniref:CLPS protein n=1 Tax=Branchiostoma lanceolatum TaxID=7740 RepID=A0A8J9ZZR0_BRALA|nr:CLPS [Branchiostoma lanceolatum]
MMAQNLLLLLIVVGTAQAGIRKIPSFDHQQMHGDILDNFEDIKDLFFNLDEGASCLSSMQCQSEMCCQRDTFLVGTRTCQKYSEEGEPCQLQHPYDLYYACPCQPGLRCMGPNPGSISSVLNTEIGVCSWGGDPIFTGR